MAKKKTFKKSKVKRFYNSGYKNKTQGGHTRKKLDDLVVAMKQEVKLRG